MQGNRKDLEWRPVEKTAGRNSGAGVPETSAASRGRSSGRFADPAQQPAGIPIRRFQGLLERENQSTVALGFPME